MRSAFPVACAKLLAWAIHVRAAIDTQKPGWLFSNSFGVPGANATYDFIVIGGGTAGNAIAARLAENSSFAVAVIEAGGFYEVDNGNGSVIPALAARQAAGSDPALTQPLIDWGFVTTPQPVRSLVSRGGQTKVMTPGCWQPHVALC